MIDCEHFFDGYKANRDYALACATAAFEAGARWVVLCDTNGGTLPDEVFEIVSDVAQHIPCLLYTSPSPRDVHLSRMPSSA